MKQNFDDILKDRMYYQSDEHVASLMTEDSLIFEDEIDCREVLKSKDPMFGVMI